MAKMSGYENREVTMISIYKHYTFGDMDCYYLQETDSSVIELMILPARTELLPFEAKRRSLDSMIQLKVIGDMYPGAYAGGGTLRQSGSVFKLKLDHQEIYEECNRLEIRTVFTYDDQSEVIHSLFYDKGSNYLECCSTFANKSDKDIELELFSSFSLGGISPCLSGDGYDHLMIHRIRSVWSMEGRLESRRAEELQLEPSWGGHAIRCERFGQLGSMPVNRFFPYLVVEDQESDIFWGAQLAHNASWQMEIYRKDDGLAISGGLADREFGHWVKRVKLGETFKSPEAILSVCKGGGIDTISHRLTQSMEKYADAFPAWEQELLVIFNEYCTTWGCPSEDNIDRILQSIKGHGFTYFVIDCGWFKEKDVPWDISMGDYQVSEDLFPSGLEQTVDKIKECGMKPGIWFEIENVGSASKAYHKEEHLLKRDGLTITTSMRRFWDMRQEWVQEYLTERVINTLKKYDFSYMKIDYNDTIGFGCDGAESPGEGLRQNMAATAEFIRRIKEEIPDIVLENCASGGHRLEPLMMRLTDMASFSDAHECKEIPVIAANLHRVILPRQSQIWAVIRKDDSLQRVAYSVINTYLGRMCISGDVCDLSNEQWDLIDRGIAFYHKIAPIIKHGTTYRFGTELSSYRHLAGWQGILRVSPDGKAYALFHVFSVESGAVLSIPLPKEDYCIIDIYSDSPVEVTIENQKLVYRGVLNDKAVAVLLERNSHPA
jgi:alpha-galactosidase